MDETEWLSCGDPSRMDSWLPRDLPFSGRNRKVRLYGCACVRTVWQELPSEALRQAILVCERFADGQATAQELAEARAMASATCRGSGEVVSDHSAVAVTALCEPKPWFPVGSNTSVGIAAVAAEVWSARGIPWDAAWALANRTYSHLLRDIVGNPFRPVAFDARWRSADVAGVARGVYEDQAFDRLPLLADALMDAGCDDDQVIGHCRSDGPHVRGCWVVDLVLGKE